MKSDALGLKGEQAAARYLKRQGYKIIDRRWSCRFGELDLVAKKGGEVVFIEVKTRRSAAFGGAAGAVGWHKAARLRAAAYSYLSEKRLSDMPFRIDLVAVTAQPNGRARLEHFKHAVYEES